MGAPPGSRAATDAMVMIDPERRAVMPGRNALTVRKVAVRSASRASGGHRPQVGPVRLEPLRQPIHLVHGTYPRVAAAWLAHGTSADAQRREKRTAAAVPNTTVIAAAQMRESPA